MQKVKKKKKEVQKSGKISPMVSAEHPSCNFDDEHCSGSKQQSTAQPGAPVPRTGMIGRRRYPAEHKPCITRLSFRNLPAETLDLSAEFISWNASDFWEAASGRPLDGKNVSDFSGMWN